MRPKYRWIWPAVAAFTTAVALVAITVLVVQDDTRTVKIEYPAEADAPFGTTPQVNPTQRSACAADELTLETAVEAWFANFGGGLAPSEEQLVVDGLIRKTFDTFDLRDGVAEPVSGGPCA